MDAHMTGAIVQASQMQAFSQMLKGIQSTGGGGISDFLVSGISSLFLLVAAILTGLAFSISSVPALNEVGKHLNYPGDDFTSDETNPKYFLFSQGYAWETTTHRVDYLVCAVFFSLLPGLVGLLGLPTRFALGRLVAWVQLLLSLLLLMSFFMYCVVYLQEVFLSNLPKQGPRQIWIMHHDRNPSYPAAFERCYLC
jgi:hypothetical protein